MPQFSANLGFLWPDRPLLDRVDAAAAAGFRAVELHWPFDVPATDLRARLARHDVALLGINTPVGDLPGDFGLGALPGREAEFREGFERALAYATEAGARAIHVMAGVVAKDQRDAGRAVFIEHLSALVTRAAKAGITLLLEPINRRDKPDYFYERIEDAASIIREIGHPALKIMFDCYHVGMTGEDVPEQMRRHWSLIGHIQFAAVPGRSEPDEGEIDYRAIFSLIDALGYGGWVGAEYRPRGRTEDGLGFLNWR